MSPFEAMTAGPAFAEDPERVRPACADAVPGGAFSAPSGREGAWYCVRSHPKHEHIAAAQLRQQPDVEVFLPRIRYKRPTRFGPAWVNEALFASYLFARFDLAACLPQVQHARGVRGVVRFGTRWPTVANEVVAELRRAVGGDELRVIDDGFNAGDEVRITGGPLSGLAAVVTRVMPGPQRIAVLMEFLGQQTAVELASRDLASCDPWRNARALVSARA